MNEWLTSEIGMNSRHWQSCRLSGSDDVIMSLKAS